MHRMIRFLSLCLSVLMVLGLFAACGGETPETTGATQPEETTAPTEPAPTESPEEAKVLKILTLGHSLAVDSCHMLNLVLATEGIGQYEEVVVGTLYYSGCRLGQHVEFMLNNSPEYRLYISSSKDPSKPPVSTDGVTAKDAIMHDNWDIIVMQGGAFEITEEEAFTDGRVQAIRSYVNRYKTNPTSVFIWHTPWATPVDNDLRDTYPYDNNGYYTNYVQFNDQRSAFYEAIQNCASKYIATDETFLYVIPTGTAIENALSSYLEEKDLHRDYAHATDYGRLIAAYTWYCRLMGLEELKEIKLDAIPKAFFKSTKGSEDRPLTDMEKAIALEAINNALKNPFAVTQSQYTTAPAQ